MENLTNHQKNFLLEYFFKNESCSGWRNIATTLLEEGSCIVAGTECMWIGGIGNFIKTSSAKNFIDCSLYEFDLDYFLTSEWYKGIYKQYVCGLGEMEKEYNEILELI